jgi:formylglycine-generating enzyme required for sulfatase activity/AAA+ ATPase superfamily predicted ATPase
VPAVNPAQALSHGGIHLGDVGGNVEFSALGDIVGGDKIVNITTTIQISVEVVKNRPLIVASPYRGLDPFEDRDTALFFGRDQLIKSLLTQLSSSPILLVLGASGSGKSSLVRAGLLPTANKLVGGSLRYFILVPDVDPFESLRSSFINGGFSQSETKTLIGDQPEALPALIQRLKRSGDKWLLFIDQFEEIFTQTEESLREKLIAALVEIIREPDNSTKVVLAMRADFLERLSPFPEFAKLVGKNIDLVTDMHPDELRLAIEQPAAQHGVVFQQGLVEEIIKDVQGQAGSLPLLQYTLNLLWEEERKDRELTDRTLNTKTYRELGGVRGALQKRANEIYASFNKSSEAKSEDPQQAIVRQIFLRLVDIATVDATGDAPWRPVRRRVPIANFQSAEERTVLSILVNQKLLVSNCEKAGSSDWDDAAARPEATVEVAHEALFSSWERLENWIAAAKRVIFVKNRLADDSGRWKRISSGDAEEELWGGSRLDEALALRARNEFVTIVGGLTEVESCFLDLSAARRDKLRQDQEEQRRRELEAARKLAETERQRAELSEQREKDQKEATRKLRNRAWVVTGLGVIAASLGWLAWQGADQRAKIAEERNRMAEERERLADSKVTREHPWVNSLGMKFVPVTNAEVFFSIWDTRVQDFETFVQQSGYNGGSGWKEPRFAKSSGFKQSPFDPVVEVSWRDAKDFCAWLTRTEIGSGRLPKGMVYRLPTDEEWSAGVGLKNEVGSTPAEKNMRIPVFPWGNQWPPPEGAGNYAGEETKGKQFDGSQFHAVIDGYSDDYIYTSPVGSFVANQSGLFDMGGNVWQWCQDEFDAQNHDRVLRGACWNNGPSDQKPFVFLFYSSYRYHEPPDARSDYIGFRCVVAGESSQ